MSQANQFILADPAQDPRPHFFLHLPKTAGTSLWQLLAAQFPPEQVFPGWLREHLIPQKPGSPASYRLYRGHFFGGFDGWVGQPLRTFTLRRDPVTRAVSQYGQMLRHADPALRRKMQELGSFGACLRDPELQGAYANYQARSIALTGTVDDPELERRPPPPDDELLASAQRRLDAMELVGTTERYTDFMRLLCAVFAWDPFRQGARENVSPNAAASNVLSAEDHPLLRSLNRVDAALHAYADRLLTAQMEALLVHRREHSEFWRTREERQAFRLAGRVEALVAESRRTGPRLGTALQRIVDRAFPFGSPRRHALRPLAWLLRRVMGG